MRVEGEPTYREEKVSEESMAPAQPVRLLAGDLPLVPTKGIKYWLLYAALGRTHRYEYHGRSNPR